MGYIGTFHHNDPGSGHDAYDQNVNRREGYEPVGTTPAGPISVPFFHDQMERDHVGAKPGHTLGIKNVHLGRALSE